jgi:hypothetical protein
MYGEIISTLAREGLSAPSINRFTSAVKGFYKYCALEYQISNPLLEVKYFKVARKLPKAISIAEVDALLKAVSSENDINSLRERLIIELLYGTGALFLGGTCSEQISIGRLYTWALIQYSLFIATAVLLIFMMLLADNIQQILKQESVNLDGAESEPILNPRGGQEAASPHAASEPKISGRSLFTIFTS